MQLLIPFSLLFIFISILIFRTFTLRKIINYNKEIEKPPSASTNEAIRLSKAIQIRTEGFYDKSEGNLNEFLRWEQFIDNTYPLIFKILKKIKLNDYAYIYKWEGIDPSIKPLCLMSHFDVVVASDEGREFPAFSGEIAEGKIWGRGTLDTKNTLIAIMESCESALKEGNKPKQDIYLVFGGGEETSSDAAQTIRDWFIKNGIYFDWVWDEGSAILDGFMNQCSKPMALIGVAEKGCANVQITAKGKSGHSGMPPKQNTLVAIAKIIQKIEKKRAKRKWLKTTKVFFQGLCPYVSFPIALIFGNIWLFGGFLKLILAKSVTTRALIETTGAATMASGSKGKNILPDSAFVNYNYRILPGDSRENLLKRLRKIDKNREYKIEIVNYNESTDPVKESDIASEAYMLLKKVAEETVPDVVVLPNLVTVTTDSKYMATISDNIYRLSPMVLNKKSISTIHSQNESITFESYGIVLAFYKKVISRLCIKEN